MFFNAMLRKSQAIDQDQTLTFYAIDIIQGVPDVFARVDSYLDFILENLK